MGINNVKQDVASVLITEMAAGDLLFVPDRVFRFLFAIVVNIKMETTGFQMISSFLTCLRNWLTWLRQAKIVHFEMKICVLIFSSYKTYLRYRNHIYTLVEIEDPASSPIYWVEIIVLFALRLFIQFFRSPVGWNIRINTVSATNFATTVWAWYLTTTRR